MLILVIALTACDTMGKREVHSTVRLDPRVLQPCKSLVSPTGVLTFESILENTKDNVLLYNECKSKHDSAIVLLKELTNQKD
jgi:hypothetical protein